VFIIIFKNAMSRKVLARKVLGFKSVQVTPLTFLGTHLVAPWRMLFIPLDVNEVAIIIIILGESHHPNFRIISAYSMITYLIGSNHSCCSSLKNKKNELV
jgi:hypothetical protein